jgi:hypothetical protein
MLASGIWISGDEEVGRLIARGSFRPEIVLASGLKHPVRAVRST